MLVCRTNAKCSLHTSILWHFTACIFISSTYSSTHSVLWTGKIIQFTSDCYFIICSVKLTNAKSYPFHSWLGTWGLIVIIWHLCASLITLCGFSCLCLLGCSTSYTQCGGGKHSVTILSVTLFPSEFFERLLRAFWSQSSVCGLEMMYPDCCFFYSFFFFIIFWPF